MGDTGHLSWRDCQTWGKSLNLSEFHSFLCKIRTSAWRSLKVLPAPEFSVKSFMDKGDYDWELRCLCRLGFEGAEKKGGAAICEEEDGCTQAPS